MLISEQFVLRLKHLDLFAVKGIGDHLLECDFLEHIYLHEMQEVAQRNTYSEFFVRHQSDQIDANSNPDLGLHRIERVAKEVFDHQVLLEPFEEQFDLPALLVNGCNGHCGQVQPIAQEHQIELRFLVEELDPSQWCRVGLLGLVGQQLDRLIGAYPCAGVEGMAVHGREFQIVFSPDNEAALALNQGIQTGKVHVAPVQHHYGARGQSQSVERFDVVNFSCGDGKHHRYGPTQVDHGVRLDRCFGRAKVGPWEQLETQIDGGRVHRIQRLFQAQSDIVVFVKCDGQLDQTLRQGFEEFAAASFVGIGQGGSRNAVAQSDVVKLGFLRIEARNQVAQTFASRELRVGHANEVAPCGEVPRPAVGLVLVDEVFEVSKRHEAQHLCKHRSTRVHAENLPKRGKGKPWRQIRVSNRRNRKSACRAYVAYVCGYQA